MNTQLEALKQVVKGLERSESALHKARAMLNRAVAEAEQAQPVAYSYTSKITGEQGFSHYPMPRFVDAEHWDIVPLYTTPPQRKPLTEKEIDAAWRSCDYTVPWEQHRIDIARAVEAAHGIKEK